MVAKPKKPTNPGNELELLRRIRHLASAGARRGGVRLGIGDDCAILRTKYDEEIAITTDLSLDGHHFRLGWHPAECIGHRALARGLSDLAAMGARPVAAFLSLGLPRNLGSPIGRQKPWIERFYHGFLALADAHKTPLAGGDLSESPIALADVVLVGAVPQGRALLRSTARPGDALYVTGWLGGAASGLKRLTAMAASQPESTQPLRIPRNAGPGLRPHLYPQPRIAQGLWLQRRQMASAAIDISDGLSTDLAHLCEESRVAAVIDADALPIAPGATLDQALHGGEDYELLFTAKATKRLPKSIAGVPITRIGRIVRRRSGSPQVLLSTVAGLEPLIPRGWEHFSLK